VSDRQITSDTPCAAAPDPDDGAAARWSHARGPFFWIVIAIMDPVVALAALAMKLVPSRDRG